MSEFVKASRKKARLRLGITGPSGSGKTVSALLVAYGITKDWNRIGLVDTEHHSSELYVGSKIGETVIGEFKTLPISAPYHPDKYINAIKAAKDADIDVLIIDSISHAWAGEGGVLDIADAQAKSSKNGNSYTAWKMASPIQNRFFDAILAAPMHIITTMRSKQDYVMIEDGGRKVVRKLGMAPIQREGSEYELTTVIDVDMTHKGLASKDRTGLFSNDIPFTVNAETGSVLSAWLNAGTEAVSVVKSVEEVIAKVLDTFGGTANEELADSKDRNAIAILLKGKDAEVKTSVMGEMKGLTKQRAEEILKMLKKETE